MHTHHIAQYRESETGSEAYSIHYILFSIKRQQQHSQHHKEITSPTNFYFRIYFGAWMRGVRFTSFRFHFVNGIVAESGLTPDTVRLSLCLVAPKFALLFYGICMFVICVLIVYRIMIIIIDGCGGIKI